jgi:hypothetical protein
MDGQGVMHIAEMLKKNKTVRTLILDSNKITNTGLQFIADALNNNPNSKLVELSVVKNMITYPAEFKKNDLLVIYN